MKITTAWKNSPDGPYLVSAYDEGEFDEWGKVPEWHTNAVNEDGGPGAIRELVIEIPDSAVANLFRTPTVKGTAIAKEAS